MDFGTLLHMAKKNSEENKNDNKYYSTKFAPPKKVSKEKKLSDNIQKFLAKKEQEEKAKQKDQKEKLDNLLSLRDEKSKNKIRKMLKVTKSANRSVLEDAVNSEHTALTMAGGDQPDQDDYGYVSTEANSFYQKYIEKVKDVKEDKGFAPSRPQSLKDLTGTKERVKAAITREIEEKNSHTRSRSHTAIATTATPSVKAARTSSSSSKHIYDPEAEKRAEEEERKKREDEERKNRMKNRKPPPPMDFQALLKLAEKKQHEPVALPVVAQKKKEPERLLTLKEKMEMEERQKAREAKDRRERERQDEGKKSTKDTKMLPSSSGTKQRMEPNGRIPKLNQVGSAIGSSNGNKTLNSNISSDRKNPSGHEFKKPLSSSSMPARPFTASSSSSSKASPSSLSTTKSNSKSSSSSSSGSSKPSSSASGTVKNPYGNTKNKQSLDGPVREFPPRDIKTLKTREFPTPDIGKTRQFPPPDLRRGPPQPLKSRHADKSTGSAPKRRILDDYEDDSEYDSELDDFIDDGDCEEDISSHIKAIFGYDKSKYKNLDDGDDRGMESSFAQVQREEFISKKIGIQEDLEDMKLEAQMKKRKMAKKRRLVEDD